MSYERSDVDPLGGAVSVRAVRCVCVCVRVALALFMAHRGCAARPGWPAHVPPARRRGRLARGPRGGALVRSQPGRGSCRRRRGCIGHRIVEPQPGAPPPRPDAASSR